MKHSKKIVGFASLAAVLPFILGVDAPDVQGLADPAFWALVAKCVGAALASTMTMLVGIGVAALGAGVRAWGRAKLEDNDPSNDSIGAFAVAAGDRLDPADKPVLQLALAHAPDAPPAPEPLQPRPPPASSPPNPTSPPKSAA